MKTLLPMKIYLIKKVEWKKMEITKIYTYFSYSKISGFVYMIKVRTKMNLP